MIISIPIIIMVDLLLGLHGAAAMHRPSITFIEYPCSKIFIFIADTCVLYSHEDVIKLNIHSASDLQLDNGMFRPHQFNFTLLGPNDLSKRVGR